MTTILLHTARALTPTAEIPDAGILIREGVIEAIGPRQGMSLPTSAKEVDAKHLTAIPGFVDVHIHGAGGHDVMEGTSEAMSAVAGMLARHGTTSFVATTVAPKFWACTTKGHSSTRRGVGCIPRNGFNCRRPK
jgi:N-acetylglucosamine-6-phosphate deacetylase